MFIKKLKIGSEIIITDSYITKFPVGLHGSVTNFDTINGELQIRVKFSNGYVTNFYVNNKLNQHVKYKNPYKFMRFFGCNHNFIDIYQHRKDGLYIGNEPAIRLQNICDKCGKIKIVLLMLGMSNDILNSPDNEWRNYSLSESEYSKIIRNIKLKKLLKNIS